MSETEGAEVEALAEVLHAAWCVQAMTDEVERPFADELRDYFERDARHIIASDWLAAREAKARAEALREAADAIQIECAHFDRYRGNPEWCGYCEAAADLLRDRAAAARGVEGAS